jgi:CheY-like chemotaxis protein
MKQETHVLIVDDDLVIRHLLSEVLQDDGYIVTTAEDGAQGLEHFHRQRPDLVISDTHMPRMDGPELVRQLRAADPALPIIVLNSMPEILPDDNEECPRTRRVFKPFDLSEIRCAINEVRAGLPDADHATTRSSRPHCPIEIVEETPPPEHSSGTTSDRS